MRYSIVFAGCQLLGQHPSSTSKRDCAGAKEASNCKLLLSSEDLGLLLDMFLQKCLCKSTLVVPFGLPAYITAPTGHHLQAQSPPSSCLLLF